jgi:nucleotide-binding universal stress UspA family protein
VPLEAVHVYARGEVVDLATHAPLLTTALGRVRSGSAVLERVEQQALHERLAAQERAEEWLRRHLREALAAEPPVAVTARVILDDHPGRGLVDAARGAGELVVGARGRGAIAGLLLGSVSRYCVLHAAVPVTVVPPAEAA